MTRTAIILPLLLLGACQVEKDSANGTTTVSFNEDVAENTAEAVGNAAETIGGEVVNDVKEEGAKLQNEIGDVDVDVDVKTGNEAAANNN